jgi:hypothetical protein
MNGDRAGTSESPYREDQSMRKITTLAGIAGAAFIATTLLAPVAGAAQTDNPTPAKVSATPKPTKAPKPGKGKATAKPATDKPAADKPAGDKPAE